MGSFHDSPRMYQRYSTHINGLADPKTGPQITKMLQHVVFAFPIPKAMVYFPPLRFSGNGRTFWKLGG